MEELIGKENDPPMLYVDNKATISLIKNPVLYDRRKHIEIRFHYIRECVDRGLIKIDFVQTEEQLGDIFTKSLERIKFEQIRSKIKVQIIRKYTTGFRRRLLDKRVLFLYLAFTLFLLIWLNIFF